MLREVDLKEISDGKLYGSNDMVRADCGGCEGCSACCRGMGETVVLDPLDVFRLTTGLSVSFENLLEGRLALRVVDGLILPYLQMTGREEACSFLDADGRCSVHELRPGICRLFPLGRFYEGDSFQYFLQVHECKNPNRTKIKVKKWMDMPDIKSYEQFVRDWHALQKDVQARRDKREDWELRKVVSMRLLQDFFANPFEKEEEFYVQFYDRLKNFSIFLMQSCP